MHDKKVSRPEEDDMKSGEIDMPMYLRKLMQR